MKSLNFYHSYSFELLLGWSSPHSTLLLSAVLAILQHLEFLWTRIFERVNGLILYNLAVNVVESSAGLHSPADSYLT